jgi:UDP-glucose 4-epimerase
LIGDSSEAMPAPSNSRGDVVVITGACGFIGAHCTHLFARERWRVLGVDRRRPTTEASAPPSIDDFLTDELISIDRLAELLAREKPRVLIHAAGPANVEQSMRDPRGDFLAQVSPWLTTLEAVRCASPSTRLVLCSSAAVYGAPDALPIGESAPVRPISAYGWHKQAKERLLSEYVALYGLTGSAARIFSTFGPGLNQLAVFDLARKGLKGELQLEGTGRETRDYLYIVDVAAALKTIAVSAPGAGEAINVASGVETEIADLARRIAAYFGKSQAKISATGRAVEGKPSRWRADVGQLAALGFSPSVAFATGLERTLDWIAEHAR